MKILQHILDCPGYSILQQHFHKLPEDAAILGKTDRPPLVEATAAKWGCPNYQQ
jgi:hypothetical protein